MEELKLKLHETECRTVMLIEAMDRLAWHGHLQASTCASDEVNADLRFAADVLAQAKQPLKGV
ncbi:hypothetical protein X805_30710 [Sphaerotilus natans subsp. natans DSM 6575]|uniref:Uncharacterized protein n=1 Tax=Sphaerotilus natans subsp. natans DSM 6575 TaxID=1286631 RepID=A0A059KIZ0_9BURK|nr:hypothetical protein X805_30710 [Sphaerotilus natans subsp. natans DSM 6575]